MVAGLEKSLTLSAALLLAALPIGSFLGLVVVRLPAGRPVLFARSACDHCGEQLEWRDLLPIVSQLASRFRCRFCCTPIGWFYPMMELAALVPVAWAMTILRGWPLMTAAGLGWQMIAVVAIDWRTRHVPHVLAAGLFASGVAAAGLLYGGPVPVLLSIGTALAIFAGFMAFSFCFRLVTGRIGADLESGALLAGLAAWLPGNAAAALLAIAMILTVGTQSSHRSFLTTGAAQSVIRSGMALAAWLIWLYSPRLAAG
jgi:leader peptidase (prepilin peptidase)/N-methyltransferase